MPDNVFRISIVAVDKATAVARGVNAAFAKFTKPVTDLRKSVVSLGRETGLADLAKSATRAASAAGGLATQVRGVVTPLAAIAGIGVTASIVEMTRAWVDQGAEVARTSRILGIYQNDLQSVRNVGRLFGVDTGAATGALQEFGNAVQGALFGRNQDALAMLNALHVGVVRLKNGSIDTVTMMKRVADSAQFQKANAQTKQFIASTLGLSALLPVMLQGSAGIEKYQRDLERLGAVQSPEQIKRAEAFAISQQRLGIAFQGLSNTVMSRVIPIFEPIIDHTTEWIAKNRELIGQKLEYYAGRIADGIQKIDWDKVDSGLHSIVDGVKSVVDMLGGLKNTAIGVGIALNAGLILNVLLLGKALIGTSWELLKFGARMAVMTATALPGMALKVGLAVESLAGLASGIPVVGVALEGLSGAFVALGAALEATPIGWIITGLAAIALVSYELYEHWTQVKNLFNRMWNIPAVKAFITATMPLVGVAIDLVKHWDAVWDKLKDIGSWLADSWIGKALSWQLTGDADTFSNAMAPVAARPVASAAKPAITGAAAASVPAGIVPANDVGAGGKAPRGIRNNNPGNLRFAGQAGATSDANGFAVFTSMQAGVDAMNRQLKLYDSRGINSVNAIFDKYAPSNENNTAAYKASVANDLGVGFNQKLNMDAPTLQKLDRAIVSVEDGRQWSNKVFGNLALAPSMSTAALAPQGAPMAGPYAQAAAAVPDTAPAAGGGHGGGGGNVITVVFSGAPAGMTATVSGPGADRIGLKIEHAMQGPA